MIILPIVLLSTLVGNSAFFNFLSVFCFSTSAAFLSALILSFLTFLLSFIFFYSPYTWYWIPYSFHIYLQPIYLNFYSLGPIFIMFPMISVFVLHWLPIFAALFFTPLFGKMFSYTLSACHWQEKIHCHSQRCFYILGGLFLSSWLTTWSFAFLHPEFLPVQ